MSKIHIKPKVKKNYKEYDLDLRIEDIMSEYEEMYIKGHYTKIGEYSILKEVKNLVNKVAAWYELRCPEHDIKEILYKEHLFGETKKVISSFDSYNILSFENFISLLSHEEKYYLGLNDEDDAKKNMMLDAALYKIIEMGGNRIGAHRGLKFAKEFGRDVAVPLIYGIDTSDPEVLELIEEGIASGASFNTECVINYAAREKFNCNFSTEKLREVYFREKIQQNNKEAQWKDINRRAKPCPGGIGITIFHDNKPLEYKSIFEDKIINLLLLDDVNNSIKDIGYAGDRLDFVSDNPRTYMDNETKDFIICEVKEDKKSISFLDKNNEENRVDYEGDIETLIRNELQRQHHTEKENAENIKKQDDKVIQIDQFRD